MDMEDKSSKKSRRLENKKRKVEAFLRLAEENDNDRRSKKQRIEPSESSSSSDGDDNSKRKKVKTRSNKKSKTAAQTSTLETKKKKKKSSDKELSQTEKEAKALREAIIARKKLCMERPKLYLWSQYASLNVDSPAEPAGEKDDVKAPPLFVIDVQQVLLFAIQGGLASYKPRFCTLLRSTRVAQVMVVVVNGLSLDDYRDNRDCFPHLRDNFNIKVPLVSPTQYGFSVADELFDVPLSEQKIRNRRKKADEESTTVVLKQLHTELDKNRVIIPLKVKAASVDDTNDTSEVDGRQPLTRVDLLLSPLQMLHETYPLPAHTSIGQYVGYKFSKDKYKKVTPKSPLFALDCEMCETDKMSHELAWVAVVNEQSEVIYESYVKPRNPIINYLTRFSGITKNTLENVTTRIEDVQEHLRKILPADAILCGQSFNNDLHALQMFHPYVIDTSVIFNLSGIRRFKPSLRLLAQEFLGEDIQSHGAKGHSPVEDSLTTMKLVQLKLSVAHICYGDVILHDVSEATLARQQKIIAAKNLKQQDGQATKGSKSKSKSEESDASQSSDLELQKGDADQSLDSKQALKQVFFKRPGTNRTESLFDIIKEMNKKALYVAPQGRPQVPVEAVNVLCETRNDKKTVRAVRTHIHEHRVCYVELHAAALSHAQEDSTTKKMILQKLDKRIKKLVSAMDDKSLVAVLFPGRTEGDKLHDGLGCFQVTGWQDYAPPNTRATEKTT